MSHCMVTLSANAGVSLVLGQTRVWIDVLHNQKTAGFSSLSPFQWACLKEHPAFVPPHMICFTHCHPDHYDRGLVQESLSLWPQVKLILPEPAFERQILLTQSFTSLRFLGVDFQFFRLPHAGTARAHISHYGLLAAQNNFHILIAGDCTIAAAELKEILTSRIIDLAILNFPWLTLPQGRAFLREVIRPRHLLICHLPFSEDDLFGYRKAAKRAIQELPECTDLRLLQAPFQSEII